MSKADAVRFLKTGTQGTSIRYKMYNTRKGQK